MILQPQHNGKTKRQPEIPKTDNDKTARGDDDSGHNTPELLSLFVQRQCRQNTGTALLIRRVRYEAKLRPMEGNNENGTADRQLKRKKGIKLEDNTKVNPLSLPRHARAARGRHDGSTKRSGPTHNRIDAWN